MGPIQQSRLRCPCNSPRDWRIRLKSWEINNHRIIWANMLRSIDKSRLKKISNWRFLWKRQNFQHQQLRNLIAIFPRKWDKIFALFIIRISVSGVHAGPSLWNFIDSRRRCKKNIFCVINYYKYKNEIWLDYFGRHKRIRPYSQRQNIWVGSQILSAFALGI